MVFAQRKVQSQKPWYLHTLFDNINLQSKGELFGRALNLRRGWYTIGKEVLPQEDKCWIFTRQASFLTGGDVLMYY